MDSSKGSIYLTTTENKQVTIRTEAEETTDKPDYKARLKIKNPWYTGKISKEIELISNVLELVSADDLFEDIDSILKKKNGDLLWAHIARIAATLYSIAEYFSMCRFDWLADCDKQLSKIVFDKLEKIMPEITHAYFNSQILPAEVIIPEVMQAYHVLKGVASNTELLMSTQIAEAHRREEWFGEKPHYLNKLREEEDMEFLAGRLGKNFMRKKWRAR